MADTPYSTLTSRVQVEVPFCPDFVIEDRIAETAMEFFKDTKSWRIDLDLSPSAKNIGDYDIDVNNRKAICDILWVNYLDAPLQPMTEQQLYKLDSAWRNTAGTPKYFTRLTPDTFTIYPKPSQSVSNSLSARVAVYPTINTPAMDGPTLNDNYSAIVTGVLGRLWLMAGKEWYNPDLGMAAMQKFEQEVHEEKQRVIDGFTRIVRTVKYGGI
jgi:hypothetical protein